MDHYKAALAVFVIGYLSANVDGFGIWRDRWGSGSNGWLSDIPPSLGTSDKKEVGNVQPTDTVPANELTGPDTNGKNNIGGFDGFGNEGQYNGNENIGGVNGNGNGGDFNGNGNIGGFNGNGNGGTGNGNGNIDYFIDSWRRTTDNQSKGAVESKDGKDNVGGHTENGSGFGASGSGNDNSEKIDGDKAVEAANVGRLVQTTTPISYFRRTRRLYSLFSRWF